MSKLLAGLLLVYSMNAHGVLTCYDSSTETNSTWYVGQPFYGAGQSPDYCTANGEELAYIRAQFTGLRMRHGNSVNGKDSVVWFGDDAQFIVNNL